MQFTKVEVFKGKRLKKFQMHAPSSFAAKLVGIDDKFTFPTVVFRDENAVYKFIEWVLEKCKCCQIIIKKHFNKPFIMSESEEKKFLSATSCWICGKIFENGDNKVRGHCHVTSTACE